MENGTSAELRVLAKKLTEMREKAHKLGLFTSDRELLTCVSCGLMEDISIDGLLITHDGELSEVVDSGLRFNELQDERFSCPQCGANIVAGATETLIETFQLGEK